MLAKEEFPKSYYSYRFAWALIHPFRRLITNPFRLIKAADVKEKMKVLELGCGPGYFTQALAQKVGKKGKIYAHDIQTEMITKAKNRSRNFKIKNNINFLHSNSTNLSLADESIDLIFACNVFEEIDKQKQTSLTTKELLRIAKPNTTLFVKEHAAYVGKKRIKRIYSQIKNEGFKQQKTFNTLFSYYATFIKENGTNG